MGMSKFNSKNNNNKKGNNVASESYSLEYLHYVGLQFNSGSNIRTYAMRKHVNNEKTRSDCNANKLKEKSTIHNKVNNNMVNEGINLNNGRVSNDNGAVGGGNLISGTGIGLGDGGDLNYRQHQSHNRQQQSRFQNFHNNNNYYVYNKNSNSHNYMNNNINNNNTNTNNNNNNTTNNSKNHQNNNHFIYQHQKHRHWNNNNNSSNNGNNNNRNDCAGNGMNCNKNPGNYQNVNYKNYIVNHNLNMSASERKTNSLNRKLYTNNNTTHVNNNYNNNNIKNKNNKNNNKNNNNNNNNNNININYNNSNINGNCTQTINTNKTNNDLKFKKDLITITGSDPKGRILSPTISNKSSSPSVESCRSATPQANTVKTKLCDTFDYHDNNSTPGDINYKNNNYENDCINSYKSDQPIYYATSPHIIELNEMNEDHPSIHGYYTFYGSHPNLYNWTHLGSPSSGISSPYNSSDKGLNLIDNETDELSENFQNNNNNNNVINNNNTTVGLKKKNPSLPLIITNGAVKYRNEKKVNLYTLKTVNEYYYTPPDRFLSKSHLMQVLYPAEPLSTGSEWDKISQNLWDRFMSAQQTEVTFKRKILLWKNLFLSIKKAYPRYGLYLVGSTITGFGTDNSDIDMCLVSRYTSNNDPRIEAVFNLTELRNYLMNTTYMFNNFNLIHAKVPILRFKDVMHSYEIDLNFNNSVGIRNTHLLYCYHQMDWRLKPLIVVVKLWAQHHNINNAKNMTISSYSLELMVIHFLQCGVSPSILPCLHNLYPEKFQKFQDLNNINIIETIKPSFTNNNQSLGELFYRFLEYYCNFDYSQYAISVRTASVLPIEECRQARSLKNDPSQWTHLCIEEPFELTNTARSVYDGQIFDGIKSVFSLSLKILQETMDLDSVFSSTFLPIGKYDYTFSG